MKSYREIIVVPLFVFILLILSSFIPYLNNNGSAILLVCAGLTGIYTAIKSILYLVAMKKMGE